MKVSEVMTRDVEFIEGDALVREAATLMGELDVGALPVGGPDDLEGIVTDRDILYRVAAQGLDCSSVRVRDVLSSPVLTCDKDDSVRDVMDRMAVNHVRRMPVRDKTGRVTGWLTLADLSRRLLLDSAALQASLREITETTG